MIETKKRSVYVKAKISRTSYDATLNTRLTFTTKDIVPILMKLGFFGVFFAFSIQSSWFFTIVTGLILFFSECSKKTLQVLPFSRTVVRGTSIFGFRWENAQVKWPAQHFLSYETRINPDGKIGEIMLIAQSEDKKTTVQIYSFTGKEVFDEFMLQYNAAFPDHKIRNV